MLYLDGVGQEARSEEFMACVVVASSPELAELEEEETSRFRGVIAHVRNGNRKSILRT
jgi:hypothetical protein